MESPSWADVWQAYAAVASALISALTILLVVLSLRQASKALLAQNKSIDIATVIAVFERLDAHWTRFKSAEGRDSSHFEFGQLISYYELSCGLFRDRILETYAAATLYEHLHDVLTTMRLNDDFKRRFDDIKSQEDNYENISWLCKQPRTLRVAKPRGIFKRLLRRPALTG